MTTVDAGLRTSFPEKEDSEGESDDAEPYTEDDPRLAIARKETRFVWMMRVMVLVVLVLSTLIVATATYRITSTKERTAFEESFENDARKVLDSVGKTVHLSLTAMDSLVATSVSSARSTNQTWPFVTIPDFEVRCAKVRVLSRSVVLTMYHVVTSEQRTDWEAYTVENNWWLNQSIAVQERDPNYHGPINYDFYTLDFIFDNNEDPQPERPIYLVAWQSSPSAGRYAPYNWDFLALHIFDSETGVSSGTILEKHIAELSASYHLPDPDDPDSLAAHELDVDWYSDFVKPGQNPEEPIFDILYPILDYVDNVTITNPKDVELVGVLGIAVYWRNLIEDILPRGSDGVVLVVDNVCNPSFTFAIDGPAVDYMGQNDLHDPTFEKYVVSENLLDLDAFASAYAGVAVDTDGCQHAFRVYPSKHYKDRYVTNQPVMLTIVVVVIFVFTSAVFLSYDTVVEYRQKLVLNTASETSKIVSNLFPDTVRDRLLQEGKREETSRPMWKADSQEDTFSGALRDASGENGGSNQSSLPIADLFPHTTIFFADLAGFTQWSSQRTPTQVFQLLEAIFGEFDRVARKRKVFKVETIGDCYVAVTGLPQPQKKHAVIMVLFATECMNVLGALLEKLSETLGDDTVELAMRIGLHSGPTTAGVLRGDKGRFQLFGDTVNTASRMESNGVRGRIHVSQSTADELTSQGKGYWLIPREDVLQVKGKGDMKTYFVSVGSSDSSDMHDTDGASSHPSNLAEEQNADAIGSSEDQDHLKWIEMKLSERFSTKSAPRDKTVDDDI